MKAFEIPKMRGAHLVSMLCCGPKIVSGKGGGKRTKVASLLGGGFCLRIGEPVPKNDKRS